MESCVFLTCSVIKALYSCGRGFDFLASKIRVIPASLISLLKIQKKIKNTHKTHNVHSQSLTYYN